MSPLLRSLLVEEDGATLVEYALVVALGAAATIAAIGALASSMIGKFASVATTLGG